MNSFNSLLEQKRESRFAAYRAEPMDILEHYNREQTALAGGYGFRQVLELVQNAADAILEEELTGGGTGSGRIEVLLTGEALYAANTGAPLSPAGVEALLQADCSPKRLNQIGRFGIGFKSLLRLDAPIDIFSSTGGLHFDPARCRHEVCDAFHVEQAPALRLAWSPEESERERDPILRRFDWATTIVRAMVGAADREEVLTHLRAEISGFPAEFVLFLPVPVAVSLEDQSAAATIRRSIARRDTRDGTRIVAMLSESAEPKQWLVVNKGVSVSDERARRDATGVHLRDIVPVAWAYPLDATREEAGRFWAFFPTATRSFVPGIVNAPWKLNSDRTAIIAGAWNSALMAEAARMIAGEIPGLATATDPGRPLDAFPRVSDKDEIAAPLVEGVWRELQGIRVIPDATGVLRIPSDLARHPRAETELAERWVQLANDHDRRRVVHSSCLKGDRGSRLAQLSRRIAPANGAPPDPPSLREIPADQWIGLVASVEPGAAGGCLRLVEALEKGTQTSDWHQLVPKLRVLPSEAGRLVTPPEAIIAPAGSKVPGRSNLSGFVLNDAEARRIATEVLHVSKLDEAGWKIVLAESLQLARGAQADNRANAWQEFWSVLRSAPSESRGRFVRENAESIRVCRGDQKWVRPELVLLAGRLVPQGSAENSGVLIHALHDEDQGVLRVLGVTDFPEGLDELESLSGSSRRLLEDWLKAGRDAFSQGQSASPSRSYVEPGAFAMPRGWDLLPELEGIPRSKLTQIVVSHASDKAFNRPVRFRHITVNRYLPVEVAHPLTAFIVKHGRIWVGRSLVDLAAIVARREVAGIRRLDGWGELAPNLGLLSAVVGPEDPGSNRVRLLWQSLMSSTLESKVEPGGFQDLWESAGLDDVVPTEVPGPQGPVPLEHVLVTSSPGLATRMRSGTRIIQVLDDRTRRLWIARGARNLEDQLTCTCDEQTGPVGLLTSAFPELTEILQPEAKSKALHRSVRGLALTIHGAKVSVPCYLGGEVLQVDQEALARLSRAEQLQTFVREISAAGWLSCPPYEALAVVGAADVGRRRAAVACAGSLPEKLAMAVGGRAAPLIDALGELGKRDFITGRDTVSLADLVLSVYGPASLSVLAKALEQEGLRPPTRWNSADARAFVAAIEFPSDFAATADPRREAEEWINGPIPLPTLHDFQVEVFDGIRRLLASHEARRRAVVSLPTGGGKTRVTVQAAVELVLKSGHLPRTVVWIAQADELCEQAVQAFRQVWVNLGSESTDLRIVRMWGGNPTPVRSSGDSPVVVVCSIQTLNSRMSDVQLNWLSAPGLVVIDECHHAIAKSYTNVLRWLDGPDGFTSPTPQVAAPIIGLSATPFRVDEVESSRLAARFDRRWLPADQQSLHERLLRSGVLATVVPEALETGASVPEGLLSQLVDQEGEVDGTRFENLMDQINRHLAGVPERNQIMMDCIRASTERSVLFFANSLDHAVEMAARLHIDGIPAAAVSGQTPAAARRYFLDEFRGGRLRVLCNHSLLSTGFDAPKTDMVLVSRNVYSPVRFMQMVGRGMRGQANGGTECCRLVTVMDNLGRFGNRRPFDFCQQYFTREE